MAGDAASESGVETASAGGLVDLAAREGWRWQVRPEEPMSGVVAGFESDAAAPGVMVVDDGRLIASLTRRALNEAMTHLYFRELFWEHPIRVFLRTVRPSVLCVEAGADISSVVIEALRREPARRFEPIVVTGCEGGCAMLDFPVLLNEQCGMIRRAEQERQTMQQKLVAASRAAGMAEVASGVLHNVGNVLNGAGVSVATIARQLSQSRLKNLSRLVVLVNEHRDDPAAFFTADPRGRELPGYLADLGAALDQEQTALVEEVRALRNSIDHVTQIVASQQTYATGELAEQAFDMGQVVQDVVRMDAPSLQRHRVTVEVAVAAAELRPVVADMHLVMQVVMNLLKNAKEAVESMPAEQRWCRVDVEAAELEGRSAVRVRVTDGGVGIDAQVLPRIFQYGFTTRAGGHGIGLHNAANAARRMGGLLEAHSDGPGRGATFTLTLPRCRDGRQEASR